jgi:hypothetical protein
MLLDKKMETINRYRWCGSLVVFGCLVVWDLFGSWWCAIGLFGCLGSVWVIDVVWDLFGCALLVVFGCLGSAAVIWNFHLL